MTAASTAIHGQAPAIAAHSDMCASIHVRGPQPIVCIPPACCCAWPPACPQDVILRGGKALPLYARVAEAGVPQAIVLPAQAGGQLQVGSAAVLHAVALIAWQAGGALLCGRACA